MLELCPPVLTWFGCGMVKFISFRNLAHVFGLLINQLLCRSFGISVTICLFGINRPVSHLIAKLFG